MVCTVVGSGGSGGRVSNVTVTVSEMQDMDHRSMCMHAVDAVDADAGAAEHQRAPACGVSVTCIGAVNQMIA
jgi:hypothetical protein